MHVFQVHNVAENGHDDLKEWKEKGIVSDANRAWGPLRKMLKMIMCMYVYNMDICILYVSCMYVCMYACMMYVYMYVRIYNVCMFVYMHA